MLHTRHTDIVSITYTLHNLMPHGIARHGITKCAACLNARVHLETGPRLNCYFYAPSCKQTLTSFNINKCTKSSPD